MSVNSRQPRGKYMDMTHPAHVRPSTTSKPVIVGNRPMLASDPMIAELAERVISTHKGSDEESSLTDGDTHPSRKVVEPPSAPETAPTSPKHHEDHEEGEAEYTTAPEIIAAEALPADDSEETAIEETEVPAERASKVAAFGRPGSEPDKEPNTHAAKGAASAETSSANAAVLSTPVIDTGTEPDTPTPEDEAAAHAEQVIAEGTYFLSIGQAKHRGQRVVFGLCLIVVLAVVVLDVLLDTGIISLAVPHTTFFSS